MMDLLLKSWPFSRILDDPRPWRAFLCTFLVLLFCVACDQSWSKKSLFHEGRDFVIQGQYGQAIPKLERYLAEFPDGRTRGRKTNRQSIVFRSSVVQEAKG